MDSLHFQSPTVEAIAKRVLDVEQAHARVEVLLLDGGGVLFNNVMEDPAFLSEVSQRAKLATSDFLAIYDQYRAALEIGRDDIVDLVKALIEAGAASSPAALLEALEDVYVAHLEINLDILGLIRLSRGKGVRLVLANNEVWHWETLKNRRFHHLGLFDLLASSWRLGARKPEQGYFSKLCAELGQPVIRACLLIDDNEPVVRMARANGIDAVLFAPPFRSS